MTNGTILTGRKVLIIAMACFGTVIAANMAMLFAATGSFPGLVVKNSYVASQGWNERTAAQAALGWTVRASHTDGQLTVDLRDGDGAVTGADISVRLGRPATDAEDRTLELTPRGMVYQGPADLAPGIWLAEIDAVHGTGTHFTATARLVIPE